MKNEAWEEPAYVVSCGDSRWVRLQTTEVRPGWFRAQSVCLTGEPAYSTNLSENWSLVLSLQCVNKATR